MTEITDQQMAQGARMSAIAWRHLEKIRMGLAPKRRFFEGFGFRWQTVSGGSRPVM
jgi:hypothetical protein